MSLKLKQVFLTLGWTTIFLLSASMPFGFSTASLVEESSLSYPPFTKKCTDKEVKQYAKDFPSSEFARLALTACGSKAIPYLIALVEDENNNYQCQAAKDLAGFGQDAEQAVPVLTRLFKSRNRCINPHFYLAEIGKAAVPNLIEALKEEDQDIRIGAAIALGEIGKDAKDAVPALIEALNQEESGYVASYIIEALGEIGQEAETVVPTLLKFYKAGKIELPSQALGKFGSAAKMAIPYLIEALKQNKESAAWALGQIGKEAVPDLIETLKHPDENVRISAAYALVLIDKKAEAAVPSLKVALKDKNPKVRVRAAVALAQINPAYAKLVMSDLIAALTYSFDEKDRETQVRAAVILGNLGQNAQKVVPTLSNILREDCRYTIAYNIKVCVNTVIALGKIGKAARAAVPALIEVLKQERVPWNTELRANAALALGKIGADTNETVAALVAALGDGDQEVRSSAAIALEKIGVNLKDLIPRLIANLNAQDEDTRRQAALALGTIGQDAVPALIKALNDDKLLVRQGAAFALGYIQPPAKEVIEKLETIVRDESKNLELRRIAASSLEKLGQDTKSFFEKYNLVNPSNAVCPPISFGANYAVFEFDAYTGKCIYFYQTSNLAGAGSLIDAIRKIFGGKN